MNQLFVAYLEAPTPDGFRAVMPYRGRSVRVREADGIHLNIPGTAIAAKLVAAELRKP